MTGADVPAAAQEAITAATEAIRPCVSKDASHTAEHIAKRALEAAAPHMWAAALEWAAQQVISALVKEFGPHQAYDAAQRDYVPDGNDADGSTMIAFTADDGERALRPLTYGEIAEAVASLLRQGGEGGGA